jgi:hypothetical protein
MSRVLDADIICIYLLARFALRLRLFHQHERSDGS